MSTLRDLGEFPFIGRIAEIVGTPPEEVVEAIGDDAAVIDVGAPEKLIVTTDAALQDRHFSLDWMTPYQAGHRAAAGAVSDIAAMGATPFASLCTMCFPTETSTHVALDVARGIADAGACYHAPLIGGDTVAAFDRIMTDIIVLGWAERPWLRSGVSPEDRLLVTGFLGDPAAAIKLLSQHEQAPARLLKAVKKKLLNPSPRIQEAQILAQTDTVHAAIDISDGLAQDAGHLARQSALRIEINVGEIPIAPACREAAEYMDVDPLQLALASGEEYELLLAVAPDDIAGISALLQQHGLGPITQIGTALSGAGVAFLDSDGNDVDVVPAGWDHFAPRP